MSAAPPVYDITDGVLLYYRVEQKRSCTDFHFLVDHPWDMDCDRILSQEEIF